MARPLRTEYAGAIYHVMSRGNARQRIFRDDADPQNGLDGLEDTVVRYGWEQGIKVPPESVSNLTRRIDRDLPKNSKLRQAIQAFEKRVLRQITTNNKV